MTPIEKEELVLKKQIFGVLKREADSSTDPVPKRVTTNNCLDPHQVTNQGCQKAPNNILYGGVYGWETAFRTLKASEVEVIGMAAPVQQWRGGSGNIKVRRGANRSRGGRRKQ